MLSLPNYVLQSLRKISAEHEEGMCEGPTMMTACTWLGDRSLASKLFAEHIVLW